MDASFWMIDGWGYQQPMMGDAVNDEIRRTEARPRLWIACHYLGIPSEVWILRQAERLRHFDYSLLYWEDRSRAWCETDRAKTIHVPFPVAISTRPKRWLRYMMLAPSLNFYGSAGAERCYLANLAREARPDVVLAHFGPMALRMLPVMTKLRVPVVAHFHGYDVSSLLSARWYRWSLRHNLGRFAAAVAVGSHQCQLLKDMGMPQDRLHLIPCGVPTDEFVPAADRESSRTVRFLTVSRLVDIKGIKESLYAFDRLLDSYPDAELHIVGDGDLRRDIEKLASEPRLAGKVHVLGWVEPEVKRKLMQEADVFLQHSLTGSNGWVEGFGVSVAEAASTGLPVVVTRAGGMVDQVVDGVTGFIVDQGDIRAMARVMLTLARDPHLRRRMGAAGRERMVGHFDTTRQVAKLEAVLLRACQDGSLS